MTPSSIELESPESTVTGVPSSRIVSSGVIAFEAAEASLVPTLFVALTLNVYETPFVRPVIVAEVADAPTFTGVCASAPVYGVTLYSVIAPPPSLLGGVQLTCALPAATAAKTPVGADGGPEGVVGTNVTST